MWQSRNPLRLCLAVASVAPAWAAARAEPHAPDPVAIRVDHHAHLNAPVIQAFVPAFCKRISRYGKCDAALTTPHSPADLLAAMDSRVLGQSNRSTEALERFIKDASPDRLRGGDSLDQIPLSLCPMCPSLAPLPSLAPPAFP